MYNHSKTYYSEKRAKKFQSQLKEQGIKSTIVSERDYLNAGGTLYYVKWN